MAITANAIVTIGFTADGANQMTVQDAQSLRISIPIQTMPGGNTVSAGNLNTLGTSIGTAVQTALNANITQISGWTSGGN